MPVDVGIEIPLHSEIEGGDLGIQNIVAVLDHIHDFQRSILDFEPSHLVHKILSHLSTGVVGWNQVGLGLRVLHILGKIRMGQFLIFLRGFIWEIKSFGKMVVVFSGGGLRMVPTMFFYRSFFFLVSSSWKSSFDNFLDMFLFSTHISDSCFPDLHLQFSGDFLGGVFVSPSLIHGVLRTPMVGHPLQFSNVYLGNSPLFSHIELVHGLLEFLEVY